MEQLRNESAKSPFSRPLSLSSLTCDVVLRAVPLGETDAALPMLRLTSRQDLDSCIVGSDSDMGGKSRALLELDEKGKGPSLDSSAVISCKASVEDRQVPWYT